MSDEVTYDNSNNVEVIKGHPKDDLPNTPLIQDGLGCHSGAEMERLRDYPEITRYWSNLKKIIQRVLTINLSQCALRLDHFG